MHSGAPNVVFFLTDDQRFDTIGALGDAQARTPHLDRLVAMGTSFTQACIPGGTSGAVCMPSRAMLHTGRNLFHIEGAGERIPAAHTLLGEAFRGAGYRTFGAGKWHNGPSSYARSFTDGAEIFFGGMADHWNVPACHFDPSGRYDLASPWCASPMTGNEVRMLRCDHIHAGRHSTDAIGAAGLEFLASYRDPAPFFMYLSFLAPHDPRTMPAKYREPFDPERMELPPNFMERHPFDNGELAIRDEKLAACPREPQEVRRHLAEYYAMIAHLDERIGEVIDAVRARGELENTIFVLAGDNGLALGRHGLFGKQSLYEHSIRVPLVFAGPGVPRGRRTEEQVCLLDVFPTLCGLASVPVPESVEGCDLGPVMRGDAPGRDALYLAYKDLHRGVRTNDYKLIEYVVGGARGMTQLFDMRRDPWELNNLAEQPAFAATLQGLRHSMAELRDASGDTSSPWGQRFWAGFERGRNGA